MDPLTAVGLAGTLTQLLDFSLKAVATAKQVRDSNQGATTKVTALGEQSKKLEKISVQLQADYNADNAATSEYDRSVLALCTKCQAQAHELQQFLESLHKSKSGRDLAFLQTSSKTLWNDRKIHDLEERLRNSRDELHFYLTAALHNRAIKQSNLDSDHLQEQVRQNAKGSEAFEEMRDAIYTLSERIGYLGQSWRKNPKDQRKYELLHFLYAPVSRQRQDRISEVHKGTYKWVFSDYYEGKQLEFIDWLERGNGVYWITGKPGCGKSTLLKFICEHDRTKACLGNWSQGEVITANFFFWINAPLMARSQLALAKSLLHDILKKEPSILESIVEDQLKDDEHISITENFRSLTALRRILHQIIQPGLLRRKFCFFVDGLDEFDGPPREIADFITELAKADNVKLCVSSRPWPEFQAEFEHSNTLPVHEFTKPDMRVYIHDLLEKDILYVKMRDTSEDYQKIVSKIVEKSRGVFLWTFLVIRDLRNSLSYQDSIADFQRRVDAFPEDLENYYLRMLDGIPQLYEQRAAKIILMILESATTIDLVQLVPTMIDGVDPIKQQPGDVVDTEVGENCRITWKRLSSYCKDLFYLEEGDWSLEILAAHCGAQPRREKVEMLHRTVLDFFNLSVIHHRLTMMASSAFDPQFGLCEGILYHIKTLPWNNSCISQDHGETIFSRNTDAYVPLSSLVPMFVMNVQQASARECTHATLLLDSGNQFLAQVLTRDFMIQPRPRIIGFERTRGTDVMKALMDMCPTQDYMTAFAACFGLSWYIRQKFHHLGAKSGHKSHSEAQLANYLLAVCSRSLLEYCDGLLFISNQFSYVYFKTAFRKVKSSKGEFPPVQSDMIKYLLDIGADPNASVLHSESSWYIFLAPQMTKWAASGLDPRLLVTIEAFLTHGADPIVPSMTKEPNARAWRAQQCSEALKLPDSKSRYHPSLFELWEASYREWCRKNKKSQRMSSTKSLVQNLKRLLRQ